MQRELIIAIDGPSGAGKSTLSKRLAQALGYVNLDTGAMYRCVALAVERSGLDLANEEGIGRLCRDLRIAFVADGGNERVLLNGEDVSQAIRTPSISLLTSRVAALASVRAALVDLQRAMGQGGGVVLEGRDIGTVVFPGAEVKFFLAATALERGRRRFDELRAKGLDVDLEQTVREVEARDAADSAREHAPLRQADDAVAIDTTGLSIDEVFARMMAVIAGRRCSRGCVVSSC